MKITYIIGNGFDIALASKIGVFTTTYKSMFEEVKCYGIDQNELLNNYLAQTILEKMKNNQWSGFEEELVQNFNACSNEKELISFFMELDQIRGYLTEFLKLYESLLSGKNYVEKCKSEFENSIRCFFERLSPSDSIRVTDYISQKTQCDKTIMIDCINFNGTKTFETLLNEVKKRELCVSVGTTIYPVKIGEVKYVHSSLNTKQMNYHEFAFGTTDQTLNCKCNCPDSIANILRKTNYSFEDWIKDTDVFITHGISFGQSDKYYLHNVMERILDEKSDSILIDFLHINDEDAIEAKEKRKKELLMSSGFGQDGENNRIIISDNISMKANGNTSGIFAF